ncbi:hypothetical protein [Desulfosporosinus sp. SB140]|uniref:hypothetical protein n=1 Tax=Desulfosporosinus paludis TaxID=3115649 RepID=UPI00388DA4F3
MERETRISQTNLEFKYISEKLIPEQYQGQFNSYVDDYTKQLSDNYVGLLKCFANDLMNRTDSVSMQTGWQEYGKKMLDSLENGTYSFQTSENQYQNLYDQVDVANLTTLKNNWILSIKKYN